MQILLFVSDWIKNILIMIDHVWVGGIFLPHWASPVGSRWARKTCVCLSVCMRAAELRAEEPRQAACSNWAQSPVQQLVSSVCFRWCLGFSQPTRVLWIRHWTKYTLLEDSLRKQRFFRVARVMRVSSPAQQSSPWKILHWHQMLRGPGLSFAREIGMAHFYLHNLWLAQVCLQYASEKMHLLKRCVLCNTFYNASSSAFRYRCLK